MKRKNTLSARVTMFSMASVIALSSNIAVAKNNFALSSEDFVPNRVIAAKHMLNTFGCTGGNVSPQLRWAGAPKDTKSFALTMYDPDAPTGSGWWHWVAYNIPASTQSLAQGASANGTFPAAAVQGINDGSDAHYGGPCPPVGDKAHRYTVTIYALNVDKLALPPTASPALVGFMTNAHQIGKASLMVKVKR